MQYCECTNDFVNAIIDDYFNSFEIHKYYIDEYEQPYYGVLSYLHDIGYTVEYELLQETHLQDSFDSATGSVDVKKFAEDGVVHIYSNETGKDVAQIPLTKLAELEKEVKDFVEYKLSAYKVANPTKRSDLLPKSIYAFDIPNEIARVKCYKEYAEYCLKQLEQMQKEKMTEKFLANIMLSESGSRKNVGKRAYRILLNQMDGNQEKCAAERTAEWIDRLNQENGRAAVKIAASCYW